MEIEARYIDVDWDANRNVLGVRYGEPIEVLKVTDSQYEIETVTFKKTYFYFAIRVISENLKHTPFFFSKSEVDELLEVSDPINKQVWWIAKGKWIKPKNTSKWKYSHEVWRTAGRISLKIQDKIVVVNNRTNSFNLEELEYVLKDFKNELFNVILKTDSVITGDIDKTIEKKIPNIFSSEVARAVDLFIKSAQNILNEPKYILEETQKLQPIKKVRPVMRTFREISTRPRAKLLTSRIHLTSLDTTENKYAHYCIDKLYTFFNKVQEAAKVSCDKLQEKADSYNNEASTLRDNLEKPKVINKSVFEKELQEIIKRFNSFEKNFTEKSVLIESNPNSFTKDLENFKEVNKHLFFHSASGRNLETRKFSIDGVMERFQNTFFCNILDGLDFRKDPYYADYGGKYLCVEYPSFIADFLSRYTDQNISVSIVGDFDWVDLKSGYKFTCLRVSDIKEDTVSHTLTLGSNVVGSKRDFFCNVIDGLQYKKNASSSSAKYLRARFTVGVADFISDLKITKLTMRFTGIAKFELEKDYEVIDWSSINSVTLVCHPLQDEIKKYEELKVKYNNSNWTDVYTRIERNEIITESKYLLSRAENISKKLKEFIPVVNGLRVQLKKIRNLNLEFKSLGIGISSTFPSSMTYVQNPNYSGLHSSFKSIFLRSNLSLSQLDRILIIERVGLVNIATLYERWVLLLIIKILSDDFGFVFENGWEDKLIDAVRVDNKFSVETEFTAVMPNRQLSLSLSYDKQLVTSRRRPDYVLNIEHREYEQSNSVWAYKEKSIYSKMVMDAKFYDDSTESEIISTLNELAIDKNYLERQSPSYKPGINLPNKSDNRLFVIHPIRNVILESNRTSPLEWGRSADYGHVLPDTLDGKATDNDSCINPQIAISHHKLGHICVVPSRKQSEVTNNLKRLILLHLQSTSSILDFDKAESGQPPYWQNHFCPECNASELDLTCKSRRTIGGGVKWEFFCNLCSFEFEENFCFSCKAKLFKNNLKWTYHRTYAQMFTNCRCPYCDSDLYELFK